MYPGWRWFLNIPTTVLAAVTTLLSLAALTMTTWNTYRAYIPYDSHTVLRGVDADENVLYATAINTGRSPSAIRGFRLRFDDELQDEPIELTPEHKKLGLSIVQGEAQARIGFLVRGLQSRCSNARPAARYTDSEVRAWLGTHDVSLEYLVEESNEEQPIVRKQMFPGRLLLPVLDAHMLFTEGKCE
jgi:hypothetical protein